MNTNINELIETIRNISNNVIEKYYSKDIKGFLKHNYVIVINSQTELSSPYLNLLGCLALPGAAP